MQNNNQKVELIQELYDTYEDIKNHNLTLTRVYIILLIALILIFGGLSITMLFAKEIFISSLYIFFSVLFYVILTNRKNKLIARYLDWYSFFGCFSSFIISIVCNVYLYSVDGGSLLYLLLLASLIYVVFINDSKKRILIANITYVILIIVFVSLILMDYYIWHPKVKLYKMTSWLFTISVFIVFLSSVFSSYVVGLRSIEDVEKLSANKLKIKNTRKNILKYEVINKKDFTQEILQKQAENYKDLNIAIFEITFIRKTSDYIFKIDHYYQNRIIDEFASLLRVYYPKEMLIRWDLNSIVLIAEEDKKNFYFLLECINQDFDAMIRNSKDNFDIHLKIASHYYDKINTKKRPKILLEKINETIKLKYETKTLGKEYILYKNGYTESIKGF